MLRPSWHREQANHNILLTLLKASVLPIFTHSTDVAMGFWTEAMFHQPFTLLEPHTAELMLPKHYSTIHLLVMSLLRCKKLLTTKLYSYTQRKLSLSSLLYQQHQDGPTVLNYDTNIFQIAVASSDQFHLVPTTNPTTPAVDYLPHPTLENNFFFSFNLHNVMYNPDSY